MSSHDVDALLATKPALVLAYGSRLPEGNGPFPVAVVIATWNIEYRQVGDDGGGWPGTFLD